MKRIFWFIIFTLFWSSSLWSQLNYRALSFKLGSYNPKDLSRSYLIGGSYTFRLTNTNEFGVGIDYFWRFERDDITLNEKLKNGPVKETEIQTNAEQKVHLVPVYAILMLRYPIMYRHYYYFSGTVGYNLLYSKVKAYEPTPFKYSYRYIGIKWSLETGIMYRINHRCAIVTNVSYVIAKVSRDKRKNGGAPVKYIVDLTGFVFTIGLRTGFF